MASSSSSRNWLYDVFLSFRGGDVRVTFRSHFFKELDRKLITAFRDNEIERGHSLSPDLVQAIKNSRIAVVVFSENYASSSWCLDELLEIVNSKDKIVIPVFYYLDPSHVRYQIGKFGVAFEKTCKRHTEEMKNQWKKALTDVSNMLGFHSSSWDNEAEMIEEIANDILGKLLLTSPEDSQDLVGIEAHIAEMSLLLQLECEEEVRMVGIWGSSGIGKTTIARAMFNRLSRHFQSSIFIDKFFLYKSREIYRANPNDPNMKLHLQNQFLSEILGKKDIKIDHLCALGGRLKHKKVLIIIDDLDDQVILDSLVGQTQWFGSGSRIIVITNNKHFLRAHGIDHIYEVSLPTEEHAIAMLCQSAFKKNSPPEGFEKLVVQVARHAGSLPLCLNVLGSYLRERDTEYWIDMLPRLQDGLDDKIEKILRIIYDGLGGPEEQVIFRHIACLFNHMEITTIKSLLADKLGVHSGLTNLVDKSIIHIRWGHVEMHRLLQNMGRLIVHSQSIDNPEEREFLVDPSDICDILSESIDTKKLFGISLDTSKIDELHVHERAFKRMSKLRFLEIDSKNIWKKTKLHLPENFDYFPPTLRLLCWSDFPMRCMPSNFHPKNLVKLKMSDSMLHKLWEGVALPLKCLKEMDLSGSVNLKEIPDLSMATNLETLNLENCKSLVELPSSIRNLNKLLKLDMQSCKSLEILPTGFNLESLDQLIFYECPKLRTFPEFSTNISVLELGQTNIEDFPSNLHLENLVSFSILKDESDGKQWQGTKPLTPLLAMLSPTLTTLYLRNIPSLVELPSSFQNLYQLEMLDLTNCRNLETLPTGFNLESLSYLCLNGCSRLRSFPEISTSISSLELDGTDIEEVPCLIEKFSNLSSLSMNRCSRLKCVSLHISKLKHLSKVDFRDCWALNRVDLSGDSTTDTVSEETSSYLPKFDFRECFNLDPETVIHQQSIMFKYMLFSGEQVPSYFTYRTTGVSSLTIPLLDVSFYQPFFRFRVGAVVTNVKHGKIMEVKCEFKGGVGNSFRVGFDFHVYTLFTKTQKGSQLLIILDCCIPLNGDNAQWNYDHVVMDIHISTGGWRSTFELKEWGVRLLEDCSAAENRLGGNPNSTLPHVSADEEGNVVYTPLQDETEHSEESGDNNVETERSTKRMRIINVKDRSRNL